MARRLNNAETTAEIVARYSAGASLGTIARALGVDKSTVSRTLHRNGVSMRPDVGKAEREEASAVAQQASRGDDVYEIARSLGLDVEVVVRILKRKGVRRNASTSTAPTLTITRSRVPLTADAGYAERVAGFGAFPDWVKRLVRKRVTAYRDAGTDGGEVIEQATELMKTRFAIFDLLAGRVILDGEGGRLDYQIGTSSAGGAMPRQSEQSVESPVGVDQLA